jgi:Co/Zn/Cd efflux system component
MMADAGFRPAWSGRLAIALTGWTWIDPVTSLVIVAVIAVGTWGLARDLKLGLQAVPPGIDLDAVARHLGALPGVGKVHDLHVWPMSTTETALTAHLIMPGGSPGDVSGHSGARAGRGFRHRPRDHPDRDRRLRGMHAAA